MPAFVFQFRLYSSACGYQGREYRKPGGERGVQDTLPAPECALVDVKPPLRGCAAGQRRGGGAMPTRFLSGVMLAVLAGTPVCAGQSASDVTAGKQPASASAIILAQNNSCASACQAEHNRCRVATKGSSKCDEARQRCLQRCIAGKHR
ncbi:MAG: hypothetical protein R3D68_00410 [Hyphomicrobiaceae bacterium]